MYSNNNNNIETYPDIKIHLVLLVLFLVLLVWSAINPHAYDIWFLEALPAILIASILTLTYKQFRFTTFTYYIVFLHIVILLVGSKYTYQFNPLFNELKATFDLSRNYYDRVGHFAQGFMPAFMVKEFLLRMGYIKRSKMFYFIVLCIILAISASYELLEFLAALISGEPPHVMLSTQGDLWDTQHDMFMALIGGVVALSIFGKLHDKYMNKMK